jgi:hypothetical protein
LWLAAHNKCWAADRLAKRGLSHPDKCLLCDQEEETINHLLVSCCDQEEETINHLLVSCVFARRSGMAFCRDFIYKFLLPRWRTLPLRIGGKE